MNKITIDRAVVEQALEALEFLYGWTPDTDPVVDAAITALRERLEQPQVEQAPSVLNQCDGCMQGAPLRGNLHIDMNGKSFMTCQKHKYTHPQNLNCKSNQARLATLWGYEKPQPPRQPLTEEQIAQAVRWMYHDHRAAEMGLQDDIAVARAIEAAHGIKEQK